MTITVLRNVPLDIARATALLADIERKRAASVAKEAELTQQLVDAPDPNTLNDRHARDKAYDLQHQLERQLERLREGTLLAAPGITYDSVEHLDARAAELNTKITALRSRLDATVADAEALLAEAATTFR